LARQYAQRGQQQQQQQQQHIKQPKHLGLAVPIKEASPQMQHENHQNRQFERDQCYGVTDAAAAAAEQQQGSAAVASSIPPDLSADAGTFLVALQPSWQPVAVCEGFTSLQLPAEQLQAALAEALPAGHQQQQLLLPAPGCSCDVDLQLVAISHQTHPLNQRHGSVGRVQQLSNVIEGGAVLQAQQDGSSYR
jgi:hypothetical protein